jgi:hypothetical protein
VLRHYPVPPIRRLQATADRRNLRAGKRVTAEPQADDAAFVQAGPRQEAAVFVFFSNRTGCLGSIVISLVVTLLLLALLGVF